MRRKHWAFLLGMGLLLSLSLATYFSLALAQPPFMPQADSSGDGLTMDVVSSDPNGLPANSDSYWSSLSSDGQLIVFSSDASDLVAGDTNGVTDIFIHDRTADTITRISVATDGSEANGISQWASLSADGRFVTFYSEATNLVSGLTGVFLHDRQTGATSHIAAGGTPVISADGGFIAFHSDASNLVPGDTNDKPDIFVFDRQSAEITRVSVTSDGGQASGYSVVPHISANGRFVAFTSSAIDLVPGDTRAYWDVFIHDRLTAETGLVSRDPDGNQQWGVSWMWSLSPDGRYVAYTTGPNADSMPALWIHDRQTTSSRCLSCTLDTFRNTKHASFSADSRYIVFDRIGVLTLPGLDADVYVYDLLKEEMRLVALSTSGLTESRSFAPAISGDGSLIAFSSADTGLAASINPDVVQIMVASNPFLASEPVLTPTPPPFTIEIASLAADGTPGQGIWNLHSISADGRFVAFVAYGDTFVPNDTNGVNDVFVRDRLTETITRVSIASDGSQGTNWSFQSSISGDGRFVAFTSAADNLVPGDTNNFCWDGIDPVEYTDNCADIFLHDQLTGETRRVSIASDGTQANNESRIGFVSATGRYVVFESAASNLVPNDTNGAWDVFVHDRLTSETTRVSLASGGIQANHTSHAWEAQSISADGRFVVFVSFASNLVPNDTNGVYDVFVHDRLTGETTRVSVASDGTQANDESGFASISADGRFVAFSSQASNLVVGITGGVFLHDRESGATVLIASPADVPYISTDGRYITYDGAGGQIYVADRLTGWLALVSRDTVGNPGNGGATTGIISADGAFVSFLSDSTNLSSTDTGGSMQVFVASNPFLTSDPQAITPTPTPSPTPTATATPSPTPTPALADVPALIEPVDAVLLSTNRPLFRWAPSLGAVRYQLRLDTVNPPAVIVYEGTGTRYTPPTALIVGTYFWQVRALDGSGGSSDWSPIRSLTIQSAVNAAPSLNYFTTSTPTLSWGRVSQAIAYEIQVDNERSFAAPLVFSQVVDGSTFDATITPALPDGTYFWRVRAQSANGQWRPWSAIDSFIVDVP